MALNPKLTLLPGNKVRLEWTPDLTGQGYRFYVDGAAVSRTFKPDAKSTTFAIPDTAPHRYGVQKMDVVEALEEVTHPAPLPPPTGDALHYAPPILSNSVTFHLTNASRASGQLRNGLGRDLLIVCDEVLTGPVAEFGADTSWRHIVWIGGEFLSTAVASPGHIIPRGFTGIFHLEGIKFRQVSGGTGDLMAARSNSGSTEALGIIQAQGCDFEVKTDQSRGGLMPHSDIYQTQVVRVTELRIDKCTLGTNYQGLFIQNEPNWMSFHGPVKLSRLNFKPSLGQAPAGAWLYKGFSGTDAYRNNLGPWTLDDVWIPDAFGPGMKVVPNEQFVNYIAGGYHRYGAFVRSDAQGRYIAFSTLADIIPATVPGLGGQQAADCQISGRLRLGDHADFALADAGMGYVSPGYV